MSRYTLEFKLECIDKFKKYEEISPPDGVKKATFIKYLNEWVYYYDNFGEDTLKQNKKNNKYTDDFINEVLSFRSEGYGLGTTARKFGIPKSTLRCWIRTHSKEKDNVLISKRRSLETKIRNMKKISKNEKEELKQLREKNKLLELEVLYLKKLKALVLTTKANNSKAKKQ